MDDSMMDSAFSDGASSDFAPVKVNIDDQYFRILRTDRIT